METPLEVGLIQSDTNRRYSLREAARILEVPEARLRALTRAGFWESQRGPIGPVTFGFQDLLLLRTTRGLLESGVPMRKIRRTWDSLREQLAAGLPLTSITVHADGEDIVATDGNASWRPDSGQILLNFETREIAERAKDVTAPLRPRITLAPRPAHSDGAPLSIADALARTAGASRASFASDSQQSSASDSQQSSASDSHASTASDSLWTDPDYRPTADEWYELGCELESTEPERALEAYQRAAELDPELADAHVNMGRLLHMAGERGRAEPHYREGVKLDPDDPTPHFNLGVLLEELGRKDEAVLAYKQAILRDPDFADAHCNLGLLLDSTGNRTEAMRHLMLARQLLGTAE